MGGISPPLRIKLFNIILMSHDINIFYGLDPMYTWFLFVRQLKHFLFVRALKGISPTSSSQLCSKKKDRLSHLPCYYFKSFRTKKDQLVTCLRLLYALSYMRFRTVEILQDLDVRVNVLTSSIDGSAQGWNRTSNILFNRQIL